MSDESFRAVMAGVFLIIFGVIAIVVECAAYDECKRVHPAWYCATR